MRRFNKKFKIRRLRKRKIRVALTGRRLIRKGVKVMSKHRLADTAANALKIVIFKNVLVELHEPSKLAQSSKIVISKSGRSVGQELLYLFRVNATELGMAEDEIIFGSIRLYAQMLGVAKTRKEPVTPNKGTQLAHGVEAGGLLDSKPTRKPSKN